ncbi:MAG: cupredoxin domain-containing protein [Elusimicrobia bacterium]|nr:cupredoxin domain-containing protein [Elusimicrobiota bacterium]
MKKGTAISFLGGALVVAAILGYQLWAAEKTTQKPPPTIRQSIVNIEFKGTKVWVPSFLIVPLGAKVELKLINDAPSGVHGFTIPDFNVRTEVANDKPKEISFVANKPGLFPINCQLHPAHIGGQLLVIDLDAAQGHYH